ncbi:MAG: hypothetical protein LBJ38_02425 [Oscillospiraceae bacterium]|jgi:hypothetical protein|nr:hypothetical protein [Oscillospiraceae bacterium]
MLNAIHVLAAAAKKNAAKGKMHDYNLLAARIGGKGVAMRDNFEQELGSACLGRDRLNLCWRVAKSEEQLDAGKEATEVSLSLAAEKADLQLQNGVFGILEAALAGK